LAKISARIGETTLCGPIGSQKIGNKPNKCEEIWHDQYFGKVR
jgi:hypothetical protein